MDFSILIVDDEPDVAEAIHSIFDIRVPFAWKSFIAILDENTK